METILDHDLTAQEREVFLGPRHMSEEELLSMSRDGQMGMLAKLFNRRGQKEKAFAYSAQIQSPSYRQDVLDGIIGDLRR